MIVFSLDVRALYPSLKAKEVAREIAKVYIELDIKVEVSCWPEIAAC